MKKQKIGFIIDNTAIINEENYQKLNIGSRFDLRSYTDDNKEFAKDFKSDNEFYHYLQNNNQIGRTSTTSIGNIEISISKALERYERVIILTVNINLSSVYNNVVIASKSFDEKLVTVIDTGSLCTSTRFLVHKGNELLKKEYSYERIVDELKIMSKKTSTYIILDNFDAVFRSGRLSKSKAKIGNFMNIKAVLKINFEGITLFNKARSTKKAVDLIVDEAISIMDKNYKIYYGNIFNQKGEDYLVNNLKNHTVEIEKINVPVIAGIHGGVGLVAISIMEKAILY